VDKNASHRSENEHVGRAAGTVGFYTFLSRVLGLVRDMVFARYFGAQMAADAFFVAFRIPNLLRRLFAEGSLSIAFIPVFTEYLHRKSREDAVEVVRVVLTLLSTVLTVVTVLGILAAPLIVQVQAWGYADDPEKFRLTVLLTRITFPYILLISLVALFMGILNTLRHFAAPAAAPIFLNVGIIGALVLFSPSFENPVIAPAVGVLIGGILQVALQLPWLFRKGISLLPLWMPRHPAVRQIGILMVPMIFGTAIYQFNHFVGTLLATFLPEGSVSWLYYADRLVQFPLGVFAIAVSTAALPSLSLQATGENLDEFRATLSYALRLVVFITLPSMAGLMVLGPLLIRVIFERGTFTPVDTAMAYQALFYYCTGLWAFSATRVLVSGFVALKDTKTPVKAAAVAAAANGALSVLLMGPLKHGGLALALSLASTIQVAILAFLMGGKTRGWGVRRILRSSLISLTASSVMAAFLYCVCRFFWIPGPRTGTVELVAGICILVGAGALLYFAVCLAMRSEEMKAVTAVLKRRSAR